MGEGEIPRNSLIMTVPLRRGGLSCRFEGKTWATDGERRGSVDAYGSGEDFSGFRGQQLRSS